MKLLTIILFLTLNLSYAIGLKALVIPNSAEMIALSSTGIAGNIDSEINPASMKMIQPYVGFSNNQWFGDLTGSKITYFWRDNSLISFESLGLDDIELRDDVPTDDPVGYTEAKWLALYIAQDINLEKILPFTSTIDLGYKLKLNYSKLHTDKYHGYTLDIGFKKHINDQFVLGGTIQNIGKEYMGSSYVTIDPRIGFGVSYEFKLASWGTSALNDRNSIDKTTGDLSLFLYTDILYEDDKMIYKFAAKTGFPYINIMFGSSYSEGYKDFSYGLSFDFNTWSFIYGSLNHENPILGSPTCIEIRKYF